MLAKLRIFVSSPGDVAEERVIARGVLVRLIRQFAGIIEIEPIFWEHEPLLSSDTFQAQILPPSETDIVVTILWARLGTRLPAHIQRPDGSTYQSGTEYEFEDALEGRRVKGSPDLIVYRKEAEPIVSLKNDQEVLERLRQKQALDEFFQKWFHGEDGTLIAAFHPFTNSGQFEELLELHLGKLIERWIKEHEIEYDEAELVAARAIRWEGSPFRGLDVFEREHAPIFFGRTRATGAALDALRRQASRGCGFLLILGASGSGKSSLVRAGVLPLLSVPSVIEGVGLWRQAVMRPSAIAGDLFDALAGALVRAEAIPELTADGTSVTQLADMLRQNPSGAYMLVKGALSQAAASLVAADLARQQPEARLVLVVDQLEEMFTREALTAEQREGFVAALGALSRSGRVWVIGTLRSDYYDRCSELPELVELKAGEGQIDLLPPTPAEIGQMIRNPAVAAGLRFEEDPDTHDRLDDMLRDAAVAEPASLPLLEFTLDELYKSRTPRGVLTHQAYRALGGVEGALSNRADEIFNALDERVRSSFPKLFRMLVSVRGGDTDAPTRRTASLDEVRANDSTFTLADAFVGARLLTAGQADDGTATLQVTHEALLTRWPPLVAWLESDREHLLIRGRISAAAARWRAEGKRSDLLLAQGKPLDEANILLAAEFGLTSDELEFIKASNLRSRRTSRTKAAAVAALVVLAVVATVSGLVAYRQAQQAKFNEEEALRLAGVADQESAEADLQRQAAKRQQESAEKQRDRAEAQLYSARISQAHHAWQDGDGTMVEHYLGQCPDELRGWEHNYLYTLLHARQGIVGKTGAPYVQDHSSYRSLAISPDATLVAASYVEKKKVDIFRLATQTIELTIEQAAGPLAFSPDDTRLVAGSREEGVLKLYEVSSGKALFALKGSILGDNVAFSADGKHILGTDDDNNVVQWNADSGEQTKVLAGHTSPVLRVAYGKDDAKIISCSEEGTIIVWDGDDRLDPITLSGDLDELTTADFSSDGTHLAGSSYEGTVYIWKTSSGAILHTLHGHVDSVSAVEFSHDGKRLASVGSDAFVKMWDVASGRDVMTLVGHDIFIHAVAFGPDGSFIITSGSDGTIRRWDAVRAQGPLVLEGHGTTVTALAFSKDDRRLVSGDSTGRMCLWDLDTGQEILSKVDPVNKQLMSSMPELRHQLFELYFNKDSTRVISRDAEKTVRVHTTNSGNQLFEKEEITGLAVDERTDRFATGDSKGSVEVWVRKESPNMKGESEGENVIYDRTLHLDAHNEAVYFVAFFPDGKRLVSASEDGTYKLWEIETGQEIASHKLSKLKPGALLNCKSGPRLLDANWELYEAGEIELRDLATGQKILDFQGHAGGISKLALGPDGRRVASSGYHGDVMIWDTATGVATLAFEAHANADPEYPKSVFCVAFSHNGKLLASGGMDRKIKIWDGSLQMSNQKKAE